MSCFVCKTEEKNIIELMSCDGCNRSLHKKKECSDLSPTEIRVMDLKSKRFLKYFCNDCQSGLLCVPRLIQDVAELRDEINNLKTQLSSNVTSTALKDLRCEVAELRNRSVSSDNAMAVGSGDDFYSEFHDRQERANNLMIFNLKEGDDALEVNNLLRSLTETPPDIISMNRVGRKNKNGFRPIKVTLQSHGEVLSLLKNRSQKLKSLKVYIDRDLTPKQREQEKAIRSELKDRIAHGESNLTIRYQRGVPSIVSKNR